MYVHCKKGRTFLNPRICTIITNANVKTCSGSPKTKKCLFIDINWEKLIIFVIRIKRICKNKFHFSPSFSETFFGSFYKVLSDLCAWKIDFLYSANCQINIFSCQINLLSWICAYNCNIVILIVTLININAVNIVCLLVKHVSWIQKYLP